MGRAIRRARDFADMKQEALAAKMGGDWSQRKISSFEGQETIDDEIFGQFAAALEMTPDELAKYGEDNPMQIFHNTTLNDHAMLNAYQPNFNPLDKVVELYERLLAVERERADRAERELEKLRNGLTS
jgi:transcriptional regulator with XRE-family HTH domain